MVSPLGTPTVPSEFYVDLVADLNADGEGEDPSAGPAGIRVVDQSGSAHRYVMVQVTCYDRETGRMRRAPESTPVQSRLAFYTSTIALPDWAVRDPGELPDFEQERAGAGGAIGSAPFGLPLPMTEQ